MTSLFARLPEAPLDPIMRLFEACNADPSPDKLNLVIGVYYNDQGRIPQLRAVQEAERRWLAQGQPKAYRPIEGSKGFRDAVQAMLFGPESAIIRQQRATTLQAIGGTGALKIGADTLRRLCPNGLAAVSTPSWENHRALLEQAGFTVQEYPYYDAATGLTDFPAMRAWMLAAEPGTVVVLHACCHNPTGADLSPAEWQEAVALCAQRGLVPFLDMAYQGFGDGLWEDGLPARLFAESGQECFIASSFSKSFALYGERVGALTIVAQDAGGRAKVEALAKRMVRTTWSNPPLHGAVIAEMILATPELRAEWEKELAEMRDRIRAMRIRMADSLQQRHPHRGFAAVKAQRGMFSYTGLTPEEIARLRDRHHIYALDTGRICVAALNNGNIDRVLDAISAELEG